MGMEMGEAETFSVSTIYGELLKIHDDFPSHTGYPAKLVWGCRVPTNVKFFHWSLLWNHTLNIDNLLKQGILFTDLCSLCGGNGESIWHLFISCPIAQAIWKGLTGHVQDASLLLNFSNIEELLSNWPELKSREI
ncbi:hypothetical protein FRX31_013442, partial [Thalictrum thalictroides]